MFQNKLLRSITRLGAQAWQRWLTVRQRCVNAMLSNLYLRPVQVLPRGQATLNAVLVLWLVNEGGRQYVTIRATKSADFFARFPGCQGLSSQPDMAQALHLAIQQQFGPAFARSLKWDKLTVSHIAAAPLSVAEVLPGQLVPVQQLVWVQHISPLQLELLQPAQGFEAVISPEAALLNTGAPRAAVHLYPSHRKVLQAVQRHLPQRELAKSAEHPTTDEELATAAINRLRPPRLVH